ncbi:CPBP family intramembrane glutamic endopeptidase [Paenibacillus agricola]|uniref:CPBP family intramembrane metalloprotease n=1 Tax=Paenibacillus agricola TaxID=2716264 RepID=A0ABX0J4M1_9BACL|nr:CPBP family intramembrane glutamic endopeptidase [Paenibacillus agricola]NHN30370.1 CPBP family intramembrane metalloprotease [Paenibacillus agricola]
MVKRQSESTLLLLAVIGVILFLSVIFTSSYLLGTDQAEEEASQTPAITMQEAADVAVRFAQKQFQLSSNYEASTLYQTHSKRSGYLQKEHLSDTYSERFANLPIDYYEVEINDLSRGSTTYYVDINYENSQVLGWSAHLSPLTKANTVASSLVEPQALAEQAIQDQGYTLADFTKLDLDKSPALEKGSSLPAALGSSFVYQSLTNQIGEARLHLSLAVSGGKIVSFYPLFNIPASFEAWQAAQNDSASLMTRISMLVSLGMAAYALYILIRYRREITFRSGLWLTVIFLIIYIGNNFNMLPAFRTSHSEGPSQFEALFYLAFLNVIIVMMAVSVYLSVLAGKQMWSRFHWNPLPSWKESSFGRDALTAMGRGYLLCLFILGVQQVLFFIAEQAFDVWSVNDASDSVLNMSIPGFFPLMAWAAAISEEAIYRLFGIAFFMKICRFRFLAILLPSVIWALSHTQYPIYPVYTRLVEVTIIGVIFGYAFLKYGFMTVLFAHASMDSILMGMSLYGLGDWTHILIGSFYLVFPALVGWFIYKLHQSRTKRRASSMPRLDQY